ncbi:MAG: thiamine pyrophosphate-binding protein [Candidatus Spyradenecus sp.]
MKASDWIIDFLKRRGVTTLFGYIGGMATHLIDSASRTEGIRFIQTYHEQSAGFLAEGYARQCGLPGVAIVTSGPGATNLVTCIGDAYFDSVPTLFITGQVNTYECKGTKPIRQQGFQEAEVVEMVRPLSKAAFFVDRAERLCTVFEEAWEIAVGGRPGPVVIDLPMDIQRAEIDPEAIAHIRTQEPQVHLSEADLGRIVARIEASQRPLLLLGQGAQRAKGAVAELVKRLPCVVSLMGKGVVAEEEPLFAGMVGSYGNRCANLTLARADLVVAVGSRLDTRQTGALRSAMESGRHLLHIDIDPAELQHNRLANREPFLGEATDCLTRLAHALAHFSVRPAWAQEVAALRTRYSQEAEVARFAEVAEPYHQMRWLGAHSPESAHFAVDIGQNQMWAAQTLRLRAGQRFFTSGGMAPMGYALPVAIGAAFADPSRPYLAMMGDGGLYFALQSLPLLAQYHLPVKAVVFNNRTLGMITQFQTLYFNANYAATTAGGGYQAPDCEALARAFALPFHRVETEADWQQALAAPGPALIEAPLPPLTTVTPKLEFNRPFYDMTPLLPRDELAAILQGACQ